MLLYETDICHKYKCLYKYTTCTASWSTPTVGAGHWRSGHCHDIDCQGWQGFADKTPNSYLNSGKQPLVADASPQWDAGLEMEAQSSKACAPTRRSVRGLIYACTATQLSPLYVSGCRRTKQSLVRNSGPSWGHFRLRLQRVVAAGGGRDVGRRHSRSEAPKCQDFFASEASLIRRN